MTALARFLSWLPNMRPLLTRRMILGGTLGQACLDDLRTARSIYGEPYLTVGPQAARLIIQAYRAVQLPMKAGARIAKTGRAEVYARSPLYPVRYEVGGAESRKAAGSRRGSAPADHLEHPLPSG